MRIFGSCIGRTRGSAPTILLVILFLLLTPPAYPSYTPLSTGANIGIGTTVPKALLQVGVGSPSGTADLSSNSAYIKGNLQVDGKVYGDGSGLTNISGVTGWTVSGQNVYNSGTGNVGVGTVAPIGKLHINEASGNLTFSGGGEHTIQTAGGDLLGLTNLNSIAFNNGNAIIQNRPVNYAETIYTGPSSNIPTMTWGADGNVGVGSLNPRSKLEIVASGSTTGTAFQIDDSLYSPRVIIQDSGNLGLGTTSPIALLDIKGIASTGSLLKVADRNSNIAFFIDSSGNFSTASSKTANFYSGVLYVNGLTGNVGVGTTVPASKLDVFGGAARIMTNGAPTVTYATQPGDLYIQNNLEVDGNVYLGDAIADSLIVAGALTLGNNLNLVGNIGINTTAPLANLEIVRTPSTQAPLMISSTAGASGDYLVVRSSGCVGIGTINPQYSLQVKGGTTYLYGLIDQALGDNLLQISSLDNSGKAGVYFSGAGDRGSIYAQNSYNMFIEPNAQYGAGHIILKAKNGDSNVGIATIAPRARLEIAGSGTATGTAFQIDDSNYSPKITVLDNGNMGIGTITPGASLDVNGAAILRGVNTNSPPTPIAGVELFVGRLSGGTLSAGQTLADVAFNYGGASGGYRHWISTKHNSAADSTGNAIEFFINNSTTISGSSAPDTGNTRVMGLYGTGNVGIGTIAPRAKLEISGRGTTTGAAFQIEDILYNPKVTILDNGNVGIGTVLPRSALEVNGIATLRGNPTLGNSTYLQMGGSDAGNSTIMVFPNGTAVNDQAYLKTFTSSNNYDLRLYFLDDLDDSERFSIWGGTSDAAATEQFRVTAMGNGYLRNNLGIGTNTAAARLVVAGIGTGTSPAFQTSNSLFAPKVTILDNGNMGIGSVAPTSKLDVVGGVVRVMDDNSPTVTYATQPGDMYIENNLEVDGQVYLGDAIADSLVVAGTLTLGNNLNLTGNVGINTTVPSANLEIVKTPSTQKPFFISSAAGQNGDYLTVTSLGNMGIGASSPSVKFQVNGSAIITGTTSAGVEGELGYDTAGHYYKYYDGNTWQQLAGGTINYSGTLWEQSGNLIFYRSGAVGIGTTNAPDGLLTLAQIAASDGLKVYGYDTQSGQNGQLHITAGGDFRMLSNGNLVFDVSGTNFTAGASVFTHYRNTVLLDNVSLLSGSDSDYALGYNSADDTFRIADGNNLTSAPRLSLNASGYIGIGTIGPAAKLDIATAAGSAAALMVSSSNGNATHGDYLIVTSTGNLGISTLTPRAKLEVVGVTSTTGTAFQVSSSNYTQRLTLLDNGNLGLGISSPSFALEIRKPIADATYDGIRLVNTSATGAGRPMLDFYNTNNSFSSGRIYSEVGSGYAFSKMYFDVADSSRALLNRMVIDVNGNVGVGSVNPRARLEVAGSGTATGIAFQIDNGLYSPKVVVLDNGNVGMGSVSPMANLDINAGTTTNTYAANLSGTINDFLQVNIQNKSTSANAQSGYAATADNGTNTTNFMWVGINNSAFNNPQTYNVGGSGDGNILSLYNDLDIANGTAGKSIYFFTGGTAASNRRMVIDGNGNVGIGTTLPVYKLEVNGGINVSSGNNFYINGTAITTGGALGNVAYLDQSNTFTLNNTFSTSVTTPILASAAALAITPSAGSNVNINLSSTGDLAVNANQLYVDTSSGNVGVGSAAPLARFEIIASGSTTGKAFQIDDSLYNPKVTVLDNGNVGIGTYLPDYKLHVEGYANINTLLFFNEENPSYIGRSNGIMEIGSVTDTAFFDASHNELLRIKSSGNVGVGTTAPVAMLHIGAGAPNAMSNTGADAYVKGNFEVDGKIYGDGSQLTGVVGAITGLTTYGVPRASSSTTLIDSGIYLDVNGNVGVGSVNPAANFVIQGVTDQSADLQQWRVYQSSTLYNAGVNRYAQFYADAYTQTSNYFLIGQSLFFGSGSVIKWGPNVTYGSSDVGISRGGVAKLMVGNGNAADYTGTLVAYNVGVGTVNPTAKLEIIASGSTTGKAFQIDDNLYNPKVTVLDNGNVGVGTILPQANLEIGAATSIPSGATPVGAIKGDFVVDGKIYGDGTNLVNVPGSISGLTTYAVPRASSSTTMVDSGVYIDSKGNVGVGTTAPAGYLQLDGNFSTTLPGIILKDTGLASNDKWLSLKDGSNVEILSIGSQNGSNRVKISALENLYFYADTTTYFKAGGVMQQLEGNAGDTHKLTVYDGNMLITSRGSSYGYVALGINEIERIRLNTAGNLGVGTTMPVAKVEVVASGSTTGTAFQIDDGLYSPKVTVLDNGNVGIGTAEPLGKLIVTAGNVGFGTANPVYSFDVAGGTNAIRMQDNGGRIMTINNSGMSFTTTGAFGGTWAGAAELEVYNQTPARIGLLVKGFGVQTGDLLQLRDTNNVPLTSINYMGNIGVGTTTSRARLEVVGSGSTTGVAFQIDDSLYNPKVTVFDNGSVGLGTTAAAAQLHLYGSGSQVLRIQSTDNTPEIRLRNGSTDWYLRQDHADFNKIKFVTDSVGGSVMTLMRTGNVGIGTTAPRGLLEVDFGTYTTPFIVTSSGNLGLGTTLPQTRLEVGSAATIPSGSSPVAAVKGNFVVDGTLYGNGAGLTGIPGNVSGLTSYSIPRAQNANTLVDSGIYMDVNGNVGVGTTVPLAELQIVGTRNSRTLHEIKLGARGSILYDASPDSLILSNSAVTTSNIVMKTDSIERLRIIGSGNVGIGTTAPIALLQVGVNPSIVSGSTPAAAIKGNLMVDGRLYGDGSQLTGVTGAVSGLTTYAVPRAGSSTTLIDSGIYLNANGNVGVGTTAPVQKFSVSGNSYTSGNIYLGTADFNSVIQATAGSGMTFATTYNSGNNYFSWQNAGLGSGEVMKLTGAGKLGVNTNGALPANYLSIRGNASIGADYYLIAAPTNGMAVEGNLGVGTYAPRAKFELVANGTTTGMAFQIDDSLYNPKVTVLDNGNLGVGTVSPGYKLDVNGSLHIGSAILPNDSNHLLEVGNATSSTYFNVGQSNNYNFEFGWIYNATPANAYGQIVTFGYNNDFRIDTKNLVLQTASHGNVGVGTTVPRGRLEIVGTGSTTGIAFQIDDSLYNPKLLVLDNGNVGIGTTVPVASLQVGINPTISAGSTPVVAVKGNMLIDGKLYGDGSGLINLTSSGWTTGAGTVFTTNLTDNVGIGSNNPSYRLDVAGNATLRTNVFYLDNISNYTGGTTALRVGTAGPYILASGNVGIGSTAPRMALDVNGSVYATNIGISTAEPSAFLEINKSGNTTPLFMVTSGQNQAGDYLTMTSSGNLGIGTSTVVAQLLVKKQGSRPPFMISSITDGDYLSVTNAGNVGVGIASPGVKFYVNGSAIISGTSTAGIEGELAYDVAQHYYKYYDGGAWQQLAGGTISYSGTLWEQSGNLIYYRNGAVGIGTTSTPDNLLTLAQMAASDGIKIYGYDTQSAQYGQLHVTSGGDLRMKSNGDILFDVSGTNFMVNSSSVTHYRAVRLADNVTLLAGTNSDYALGYNLADDTFRISDGNDLTTSPRIVINSSGNVGIGSTNPVRLLDLNTGALRMGGNLYSPASYLGFYTDGGSALPVKVGSLAVSGSYAPTAPTNGLFVQGNVGIGTTAPAAKLEIAGIGSTTGVAFQIDDYLYAPKVTVLDNGNVGIGSVTPEQLLEIKGGNLNLVNGEVRVSNGSTVLASGQLYAPGFTLWATSTNLNLYSGNAGYGVVVSSRAAAQIPLKITGFAAQAGDLTKWLDSNSNFLSSVNASGNIGIGTSAQRARLEVAGSGSTTGVAFQIDDNLYNPKVTVLDNGNVGIGTTSPGVNLDIYGTNPTIRLIDRGNVYKPYFKANGNDDTSWTLGDEVRSDVVKVGYDGSKHFISLDPLASGVPFLINGDGNVGIGTITPMTMLHVGVGNQSGTADLSSNSALIKGNLEVDGYIYGNGANITGLSGLLSGLTTYGIPRAGSATTLVDSGIYLDANGDVGVGTATPSRALHIYGAVRAGGLNPVFDLGEDFNLQFWRSSADLRIKVGGTDRFTIRDVGNVGIGTTVPRGKLEIDGSLYIPNSFGNVGFGTTDAATLLTVGPTPPTLAAGSSPVAAFKGDLVVDGKLYGDGSNLTGITGGSGISGLTTYAVPRASSSTTIVDSGIYLDANGNVGVGTTLPNSLLNLKGSFAVYRVATAASVSSAGETIIGVTDTSSARTITLSTADCVAGRVMIIKDESGAAGTNNITIATEGAENIDGTSDDVSLKITVNYGVVRLYSNGSHWFTF